MSIHRIPLNIINLKGEIILYLDIRQKEKYNIFIKA